MESGASGEPMASQDAGNEIHAQTIDQNLSDEIRVLREQWNTLSENSRNTTAGRRLGRWISRIEKLNREIIEEQTAQAVVPAHLQKEELEKDIRCSELQMEVHQLEIKIADLKIRITEAGRHSRRVMWNAECDYEARTEIMRKMVNEVLHADVQQRIIALNRKIAQLAKIIEVQKDEISILTAVLEKE